MPPHRMREDDARPPDASAPKRRRLLQALPAAVILGAAARAAAATTDLVLACDTTLGPPLRAVARAYANVTGVTVNVFPTPPGLILPQLQRQVQNDIVMTQPPTVAACVHANLIAPDGFRGAWRNPLVVAAKRGAAPGPRMPIAASDPTPGSDMDGPAILGRLGMGNAATLGVIDTDTVAALILNGTARTGLLHMTDIRAHPDLQIVRMVPPEIQPPIAYAAAITKLARRPDPARFLAFLLSPQATAVLADNGLETVS
ncbi:MAG TPA: substrate-binding domain-containing protein [Acetobacteraceae bacterium]|jgi:molybdate transport system substrate-binding protein|nr:substrate-binding domain-containing protein [Acetobacteraceae bacterium]